MGKGLPVFVGEDNGLTTVATSHDMVDRSFEFDPPVDRGCLPDYVPVFR